MRSRWKDGWNSLRQWLRDFPATAGLLAVYTGLYLLMLTVQAGPPRLRPDAGSFSIELFPVEVPTLLEFGALTSRSMGPSFEPWRLVTATLLHAGLVHLFFNGFALFQIGSWIEDWFGGSVLLSLHFLFGLGGNIVSILFHMRDPQFAQVGASGAIFGLIAFMAVVTRQSPEVGSRGASILLTFWLVVSLLFGWTINADNAAHLGGAFAGTMASLFACILRPGLLPKGALRLSALASAGVFLLAFALQARVGFASHRAHAEARRIHQRLIERQVLSALDRQLQILDSLARASSLSLEDQPLRLQIVRSLQEMRGRLAKDAASIAICDAYIAVMGGPDAAAWQFAANIEKLSGLRPAHEDWANRKGLRLALPAPALR